MHAPAHASIVIGQAVACLQGSSWTAGRPPLQHASQAAGVSSSRAQEAAAAKPKLDGLAAQAASNTAAGQADRAAESLLEGESQGARALQAKQAKKARQKQRKQVQNLLTWFAVMTAAGT